MHEFTHNFVNTGLNSETKSASTFPAGGLEVSTSMPEFHVGAGLELKPLRLCREHFVCEEASYMIVVQIF